MLYDLKNSAMDPQLISIGLSTLALVVSGTTAYLTLFQRGSLRMTRPTMIFFGPDGGAGPSKVFLRALLYSTSRRGHVIENMFLRLKRGESAQNFNVWVYRDGGSLCRGSGLSITRDGIVSDHHFLLPKDGTNFSFIPGHYIVELFATLVNKSEPVLLTRQHVTLEVEFARQINDTGAGVFFDWGPDLGCYNAHLDSSPGRKLEKFLAKSAV